MKTRFKQTLNEGQSTNFLSSKDEIKQWLDEHKIENYAINDDLTVSMDGHLSLQGLDIEEIPVKFSECKDIYVTSNKLKRLDWAPSIVNGNFECWDNEIETLEGGPEKVLGNFDCDNNKLTSLEGGPSIVEGSYVCSNNQLTSFKGCPETVGKYFKARSCPITSIDFFPRSIGTSVYLQDCKITSLKGVNKLLKSLNSLNADKAGMVNITGNPIKSGLLSIVGVNGVTSIVYLRQTGVSTDKLEKAIAIINSGLTNGDDALDIQDKLIEIDLGDFS